MAADLLSDWWVHQVIVARKSGTGAYGDTWDAPTTVAGLVDDSNRLVRNNQGEEVVSTATVFLPAAVADIPIGSNVTLPAVFGNRTAQVLTVSRHDAGTLPLPDHLEIHLI